MEASPLRTLPGETRNQIYKLVLTQPDSKITVIWARERTRKDSNVMLRLSPPKLALALTQTCRKIRSESSGLVFALNGVRFHYRSNLLPSNFPQDLTNLIRGPEAASKCPNLELKMHLHDDMYQGYICECGGCDRRLARLVELRKWALQRPGTAVIFHVLDTESQQLTLATINLQSLGKPEMCDFDNLLDDLSALRRDGNKPEPRSLRRRRRDAAHKLENLEENLKRWVRVLSTFEADDT